MSCNLTKGYIDSLPPHPGAPPDKKDTTALISSLTRVFFTSRPVLRISQFFLRSTAERCGIRQGLIEPAIEYATESGAFDHALELARTCCPSKLPGIHLKHALFLEDEERFKEVIYNVLCTLKVYVVYMRASMTLKRTQSDGDNTLAQYFN